MNDREISEILTRDEFTAREFRGVFSSDEVPSLEDTMGLFVVNTAPTDHPTGIHWELWRYTPNYVLFFDSFGRAPKNWRAIRACGKRDLYYVNVELQNSSTNICGYYVIFWAFLLARDASPIKILKDVYGIDNSEKTREETLLNDVVTTLAVREMDGLDGRFIPFWTMDDNYELQ